MHTAQPPGAICSLSGAGSQHSAAASGDGAVSPHTSHAVQLLISSPNARRVDHVRVTLVGAARDGGGL